MSQKLTVSIPSIMEINPYKPGNAEKEEGINIINLASNENPFGCSKYAIDAATKSLSEMNRYPDGGCTKLRRKIAELHSIDAGNKQAP